MCVTYQHEVDVEIKDLVAHVDAEVVAEMVPQVGESPRRALEVCARHLHPLDAEPRVSGIVCAYMFTIVLCVCVTVSYLLGHPVIHGPQHRVQGPYGETNDRFSEVSRFLLFTLRGSQKCRRTARTKNNSVCNVLQAFHPLQSSSLLHSPWKENLCQKSSVCFAHLESTGQCGIQLDYDLHFSAVFL